MTAQSTGAPMCEAKALTGVSAVLTHHWVVRRRGGEKVLEALAELLPSAAVYALVAAEDSGVELQPPRAIHTSWLQRLPGAVRHYPRLLPFMAAAAHCLKLPDVDLVVCSDAALAKAMRAAPRSTVVCYCHSPMRYVWEPEISAQYAATLPVILRPLWPLLCAYLRRADRRAAVRVDRFIANSQAVAARIQRAYGRDATVIYPPVEMPGEPMQRKAAGARADVYYLCVGHHVAYKRLDLAVGACRRLGRRLVVIGDGPEARRLSRDCSDGRIEFLGYQPDKVVYEHYANAAALLFPGEEDFGIVPVEAMARGCPVVAYAAGGARETVVEGRTGVWFEPQTVEALVAAIERFEAQQFDPRAMHAAMQRFSRARFLREVSDLLAGLFPRA